MVLGQISARRPSLTSNKGEATCNFCGKGQVNWQLAQISFRQASDKGYVQCGVQIEMGVCEECGARTLPPDSDRIFDEEFQRQYRKLP
jgi:hypothetical protein